MFGWNIKPERLPQCQRHCSGLRPLRRKLGNAGATRRTAEAVTDQKLTWKARTGLGSVEQADDSGTAQQNTKPGKHNRTIGENRTTREARAG